MKKVLSIDDNDIDQMIMKVLLNRFNVSYYGASDAISGIAQALQILPDLIFMDMRLPDMSGLEAVHNMRQISALSKIPIIVISSDILNDNKTAALAVGANDFINKPMGVGVLKVLQSFDIIEAQPDFM